MEGQGGGVGNCFPWGVSSWDFAFRGLAKGGICDDIPVLFLPYQTPFLGYRVTKYPVLPFLAFSVLPRKNLKFTKDFLSLPNPQNPWKRQRKYQNNQGNSLLKINQGNPKNQGMEGQGRGTFNRYTKRPLQDSAIIFSNPGMGESAFYYANHRVCCKCQQRPGWKIHTFFRWNMPFAVFRGGSGVSDKNNAKSSLFCFSRCPKVRSGPGKPNQRKVSSWTFPRGTPEQEFNVNRVFFPKEKSTRIHKNGRNSWTFRFGLFFGLVCRGDSSYKWRLIRENAWHKHAVVNPPCDTPSLFLGSAQRAPFQRAPLEKWNSSKMLVKF